MPNHIGLSVHGDRAIGESGVLEVEVEAHQRVTRWRAGIGHDIARAVDGAGRIRRDARQIYGEKETTTAVDHQVAVSIDLQAVLSDTPVRRRIGVLIIFEMHPSRILGRVEKVPDGNTEDACGRC